MAEVIAKFERRFQNLEAERAHWQRLGDFWENEAFEARRFGPEQEDIAKLFEDGAKKSRAMVTLYSDQILAGK